MAPNDTAAAAAPADAAADTGKSIIGSKYRDGRYKAENQDWLGKLVGSKTTLMTDKDRKVAIEGGEAGAFKTITEKVADGVDVNAVFKLGRENGLNLDKYEEQRGSHGFAGRIRMTVRNMLQAEAKRRHGLVVDGKFVNAPADWLEAKNAPAAPTHNPKGEKIAVPKPPKAEKPAEAPAKDAAKK
jgi:hypothetical protein